MRGIETSGVLLDFFPAGPVLNIGGVRTLLSWDRLVLAQLVEGLGREVTTRAYGAVRMRGSPFSSSKSV